MAEQKVDLPYRSDPAAEAEFWQKVNIVGPDDCWIWTGRTDRQGYGKFRLGRQQYAHRISWEIENRESLGRRFACHTCDNPSCVNPRHLYAGDAASNARDASERGLLRSCDPEKHPSAKLTWAKVADIRGKLADGETPYWIAAEYKVSPATIRKINEGVTWKEQNRSRT